MIRYFLILDLMQITMMWLNQKIASTNVKIK